MFRDGGETNSLRSALLSRRRVPNGIAYPFRYHSVAPDQNGMMWLDQGLEIQTIDITGFGWIALSASGHIQRMSQETCHKTAANDVVEVWMHRAKQSSR